MALFGIDAITKIIDSIKNSIPSWASSLGNKGEKPAPDSGEHGDYEEYNPDGEYYHKEYDADDGSYSVTEIGWRGSYDDDDNFSIVMLTEHDDDDY